MRYWYTEYAYITEEIEDAGAKVELRLYKQAASFGVEAPGTHLRFIDENLSLSPVPLVPVVAQRSSVQWQDDVVCDQVCSRYTNTEPAQPIYTKDASVQSEDGEFDDADTPSVDKDVCEGDLPDVSPAKVCLDM